MPREHSLQNVCVCGRVGEGRLTSSNCRHSGDCIARSEVRHKSVHIQYWLVPSPGTCPFKYSLMLFSCVLMFLFCFVVFVFDFAAFVTVLACYFMVFLHWCANREPVWIQKRHPTPLVPTAQLDPKSTAHRVPADRSPHGEMSKLWWATI